jgi:hypothetical protein
MDNDECEVCAEHTKAMKETEYKPLVCPHCGESLGDDGFLTLFSDKQVIGETNAINNLGPFEHTDLFQCDNCSQFFILKPISIIWNANHDIYYRRAPTKDD